VLGICFQQAFHVFNDNRLCCYNKSMEASVFRANFEASTQDLRS
jgi:hypothetical protein